MNFIYKNLFALPNLRPYTKHKKQHAPGWTGWCSKSKSSLVPPGRLTVSQSVSGTLDRPRVVRSALQDLRSCAILQASSALSPVSSSICCTHVRQGRPRWRFHSGLMSGLPPARASTARRSAEWAGVASGSRRTWPKMESRLQQIRIVKLFFASLTIDWGVRDKWNQRIPKIRRWQFMWNASNRRSSAYRRVHVSEPYNSTRWQGHCKAVSSSVNLILSASRC